MKTYSNVIKLQSNSGSGARSWNTSGSDSCTHLASRKWYYLTLIDSDSDYVCINLISKKNSQSKSSFGNWPAVATCRVTMMQSFVGPKTVCCIITAQSATVNLKSTLFGVVQTSQFHWRNFHGILSKNNCLMIKGHCAMVFFRLQRVQRWIARCLGLVSTETGILQVLTFWRQHVEKFFSELNLKKGNIFQ